MNNIFLIFAIISLVAVLLSLVLGVLGMVRSSEFNKKYDDVNKDLNFFYNASSILKNHYLNDQLPK